MAAKIKRYFAVKWEGLDGMFNLTIAKFFFVWFSVSTIAAKLVTSFDDYLPIVINNVTYKIPLELPFDWLILWWAAFAYFLAMLTYLVACPKFIRDYPRFENYKAKGHDTRWLVGEFSLIWPELCDERKSFLAKRLLDKGFAQKVDDPVTDGRIVGEQSTHIIVRYKDCINLLVSSQSGRDETEVRGFWWELQARWAEQNTCARVFIRICTTLAFLLTLFVIGQNILFVLKYMEII